MPAAFAHDLYGRSVYEGLPPGEQALIRRNRDCFYMGLHGPDLLFFYKAVSKNRVNQKGCWLHREAAAPIFRRGRNEIRRLESRREKEALTAYLLGFCCHFALDSSMHGRINAMAKKSSFTHAQIETELDRRLMLREGLHPLLTNVTCHLKNTTPVQMAASRVFCEEPRTIRTAILGFRLTNRLFINSAGWLKGLVFLLLIWSGNYDEIHGMIMRKKPLSGSKEITDEMEERFLRAVPTGVRLARELWYLLNGKGRLGGRFLWDFEGRAPLRTARAQRDEKKRNEA